MATKTECPPDAKALSDAINSADIIFYPANFGGEIAFRILRHVRKSDKHYCTYPCATLDLSHFKHEIDQKGVVVLGLVPKDAGGNAAWTFTVTPKVIEKNGIAYIEGQGLVATLYAYLISANHTIPWLFRLLDQSPHAPADDVDAIRLYTKRHLSVDIFLPELAIDCNPLLGIAKAYKKELIDRTDAYIRHRMQLTPNEEKYVIVIPATTSADLDRELLVARARVLVQQATPRPHIVAIPVFVFHRSGTACIDVFLYSDTVNVLAIAARHAISSGLPYQAQFSVAITIPKDTYEEELANQIRSNQWVALA